MVLVNLKGMFNQIKGALTKLEYSDVKLTNEFKENYKAYLSSEKNKKKWRIVRWPDFSVRIETREKNIIHLANYSFYFAFEFSGYVVELNKHKKIFLEIFKDVNTKEKAAYLRDNNLSDEDAKKIKDYFETNKLSPEEYDNFIEFVSDYASWGGSKTIDRTDFFDSALSKAGSVLQADNDALFDIARQFSEESSLRESFRPLFVEPTDGVVPPKEILSNTIQRDFVNELISFLFVNDIHQVLFKCLEPNKDSKNENFKNYSLEHNGNRLTTIFRVSEEKLNKEDLQYNGDERNYRFFETPFEYDSKYFYLSTQWTNNADSRLDIQKLKKIFDHLYPKYEIIVEKDVITDKDVYRLLDTNIMIPKPFIILAGISGTGKTTFVREQAAAHNLDNKNFCLVPVRPDWHEPSDLLGYISRIGGKPEYVSTKVLQFIIEAWKAIAPNANSEGMGELDLTSAPYWLCLDEMNLAPVEQYFADYLSALESRKFISGEYSCDPLLDKSVLKTEGAKIQNDLKLNDNQNLWDFFCKNGISLPPNLIVAGTVNMDETTHGFSRKVIDRALTIDFGEFFPNHFSKFFDDQALPKILTYSMKTQASKNNFECSADHRDNTIAFLKEVNNVLRGTPFELAYRALNEALLYVDTFKPKSDEELQAIWDDFMMMKVLPRIEGDDDKLRIIVEGKTINLLEHLETILSKELKLIWDEKRTDLLRKDENGTELNDLDCRSRKKIRWMRNRLDVNTFTSYWP